MVSQFTVTIALVMFLLGTQLGNLSSSQKQFAASSPIVEQINAPKAEVKLNETCNAPAWIMDLKGKKIFSQYGEDGITLGLADNLKQHTSNKYYVEFGTESGKECNTRVLREKRNWTGLLMDGGFNIPKINLHKEMIKPSNIVQLFQKYNVPNAKSGDDNFDLFSEDTDMSDYYIWKAILEAGYRPKIVISEINSNFHQTEAATTRPPPDGEVRFWKKDSYMGVSALGIRYLWNRHGYTMVRCMDKTINCFGVRNDILGIADEEAKAIQECLWQKLTMGAQRPIHPCPMPLNPESKTGFERESWSLIGEDGEIIHNDYQPYFYREGCWGSNMRLLHKNGVMNAMVRRAIREGVIKT